MVTPVLPNRKNKKANPLVALMKRRRSWLDGLFAKSYRMKMGEIRLPGIRMYMPNQPSHVQQMMRDEVDNFPKHELIAEQLRPLLGDSIFTTNGETWKRQRSMLELAFGNSEVDRVFHLMENAVERMLARIERLSKRGTFNIDDEMTLVTADVIFRTILSSNLSDETAANILQSFKKFQEKSTSFFILRMVGIPNNFIDKFFYRSRLKDALTIRTEIQKSIEPRYRNFLKTGRDDFDDILSKILNAKDESGRAFELTEIVDHVAMLFLAGHETSAAALTWTFYLLAENPNWQQKLYEEICNLGPPNSWTSKGLRSCNSMRLVFMEALRLYPPVGFFMRGTKERLLMRGKDIFPGSLLIISPWLLHRHQNLWSKPDNFCPMRFDPSSRRYEVKQDAYIPFGNGQRVCIGAGFARQEAYLILAAVLQKYHIELEKNFVPKPVGRLTIRSENGLQISCIPRPKG